MAFASSAAIAQDSFRIARFTSLHGTTGVYNTADATVIGKGRGSAGIFENFSHDSLDRLIFNYGIHEKLEIGIRSGIPAHDPKMNFFLKFQGTEQGSFFGWKRKFLPSTAVGFNSHSTFIVASYSVKRLRGSVGYNFSEGNQSVFFNITYQPVSLFAIQAEYHNDHVAGAIRFKYKKIVSGLFASFNPRTKDFSTTNTYWNIAFYF